MHQIDFFQLGKLKTKQAQKGCLIKGAMRQKKHLNSRRLGLVAHFTHLPKRHPLGDFRPWARLLSISLQTFAFTMNNHHLRL
jgi:hypothetical protein